MTDWTPQTWLVAGARDRTPGEPLNVPPVFASNFYLPDDRVYSRAERTPTTDALETLLGGLEGGRALAFAFGDGRRGGRSSIDSPVGARIAVPTDPYHGVAGIVEEGEAQGRWTVGRIDQADTAAWIDAVQMCDLVWLESPENPLITVADLPAICGAPRPDRHAGRCRQHVRDPAQPAAARLRRRRRHALGDQVHRRSLRPARRGARSPATTLSTRSSTNAACSTGRRSVPWRRSSRFVAHAPSGSDSNGAQANAMELAGGSNPHPGSGACATPGCQPSTHEAAESFHDGVRRDDVVRDDGRRRAGDASVRTRRAGQPRDEPRRGRVDDGATGLDSPVSSGSRRR